MSACIRNMLKAHTSIINAITSSQQEQQVVSTSVLFTARVQFAEQACQFQDRDYTAAVVVCTAVEALNKIVKLGPDT